jgi:hypothetical protein
MKYNGIAVNRGNIDKKRSNIRRFYNKKKSCKNPVKNAQKTQ